MSNVTASVSSGLRSGNFLEIVDDVGPLVGIYMSAECAIDSGRLMKSAGTRPVTLEESDAQQLEEKAFIPLLPWNELSFEETAYLFNNGITAERGDMVYVTRPPQKLTEIAIRLCNRNVIDRERHNLTVELTEMITDYYNVSGKLNVLGLVRNQPGLYSVSSDHETLRYIGLHIDTLDEVPVNFRSHSRNRLSINISDSPRHFMFIPVPIGYIYEYLRRLDSTKDYGVSMLTGMAREFLSKQRSIPVIRCRIDPGEAYIATTDNLIHDGISLDAKSIGKHFVVFGKIKPKDCN